MANLIIKPMHKCTDDFQQATNDGIIDSTELITRDYDDKKKYRPFCLFSYKADGSVKNHYPINYCPFCGQNLNTLPAPQD